VVKTLARKSGRLVDPGAPSAEPFRNLRLAIELRPEVRSGANLVVTSPGPEAGKTTVACNYAIVVAMTQTRVLLVDADLRNPTIHEVFGLPRSPGLVELLRDHLLLDLPLVAHTFPDYGGLDVLTAGAPMARAGDVASSPRMADLLERARQEYDLIVLDSPPVLTAADAAGLAGHPGTDVIMVTKGSSKKRPLVKALKKLELTDANVLGLVINREGRLANYPY
jgi:tyrosine-protein kinase Etk/Wzc